MQAEGSKKTPEYFAQRRQEMLPLIPGTAKRILDVGCGAGEFGSLLKEERGVEVWGVEVEPQAVKLAAAKLDRVLEGYFHAELHLPEQNFDAIVFNDVLEHMIDPWQALRYCHRLLTPTGVIVSSLPNVLYWPNLKELLLEQDWQYREEGILDETHLRFFTRKSGHRLFATTGYEVIHCEGINPCPPFRLPLRLLNWATRGRLSDWRYLQFGFVARPVRMPGF